MIPSVRPVHVFVAACLLACTGASMVQAQTVLDGLDTPSGLGPITLKSTDLNGVDIGTGLWEFHTNTSHDGTDSVRTLLPNRSTSSLRTTVEGPAVISFWWKISAQRNFDTLLFRSRNGVDSIGMPADPQQPSQWQQRTFLVDTGTQEIEWLFQRYSSVPVGYQGEAWIDELVVTPIPNSPALQGAVENFLYSLHSTDWTATPFDGALNSNVAKSGPVAPGGTSSMVLEVMGPATIAFDWGIASDPTDASSFRFLLNNESYASIDGNQQLHRRTFEVPPGIQRLKFIYERDGSGGDPLYTGLSEGYLDELVITPFGESPTLADAVERADGVYSNAWTRQTTTTHDGSDAAAASTPTADTAKRLYAKIPDGAGLLSFWTKTDVNQVNALFRVLVDGTSVLERKEVGDWKKTEVNLGAGTDRQLEAILFRDASTNTAVSSVVIDEIVFLPGANNYQPDLSIGPRNKSLKGSGIINATGVSQHSLIRAKSRRPLGLYSIRALNQSSSDPDELTLRGTWSSRDFDILFVVTENGRRLNYTAALKAGLFSTVELDPGESESHEIWVARQQESTGRSHTVTVTGRSTTSPNKLDTVKALLKVAK
jgi:hypothetical protein